MRLHKKRKKVINFAQKQRVRARRGRRKREVREEMPFRMMVSINQLRLKSKVKFKWAALVPPP